MEKENIDVCLTMAEEVKTGAVCGDNFWREKIFNKIYFTFC